MSMTAKPYPPLPNFDGFTLVEVLVAILVLSIGLLGMAGLQLAGLRNGHTAHMRSQATLLAEDLAERMRANPLGVANGDYNKPSALKNENCQNTNGCSANEMARNDIYDWNAALIASQPNGGLPDGKGTVCIDATPSDGTPNDPACDGLGSLYAIKVWWRETETWGQDTDEPSQTTNTSYQLFVTSFQP